MEQSRTPLVSVIVPFYNSGEFLEECIESILAQTYQNWELILVNNCSTDNGAQIIDHYAGNDERIFAWHPKEFLDQVPNYNRAFSYMSPESKYCKVVQADDWIFPECLEKMVGNAEANPSVTIVGAYSQLENNVYLSGLPPKIPVFSGPEVCRYYLIDHIYVFGTPNSLLMRSDIVRSRSPFYDEDSPFEDAELCFEILKNTDFGYVNQVLTFTRRDNDSIYKCILPFNTGLLCELRITVKYGAYFLNPTELKKKRTDVERRYYRFLGESILRRQSKAFWDFHHNGIRTIDFDIDSKRLCGHVLLAATANTDIESEINDRENPRDQTSLAPKQA